MTRGMHLFASRWDERAALVSRRVSRAGVVLLAVMIAVVLISASASAVLLRADSQASRTASMLRYSQSRAAAWSGVKGVLAELAGQRAALLQGAAAQVTASWTMVDATDRPAIVARLINLGPGEGTIIQPEAGKANINTADESALSASGVLDEPEIATILEHRRMGALGSLSDLSIAPAISVERLYGRVLGPESNPAATASKVPASGAPTAVSSSAGSAWGGVSEARTAAVADVCTVFSADPTVQAGIGPDGGKYTGVNRINLGLGWSDELAGPIADRFGADAVPATRQLMQGGAKFKSMRDVVLVLRQLGVPARQWGALLDAFTTTADPYVLGRIDTLRASAAVLATVPGIDAAAAQRMVDVRDRLDAAVRREITWPMSEGILSADQFALAVDWITNRTLQWRVIVEAGRVRRSSTSDASELSDRVVYEAVLDVAGRVPRVAYLREVTALSAVRAMALAPEPAGEGADATDSAGIAWHDADAPRRATADEPILAIAGDGDEATGAEPIADAEPGVRAPAEGAGEGAAAAAAPGLVRGVDRRNGRWNVTRGAGGQR